MRPALALGGLLIALVASAMLGVLAGAVAVGPADVFAALAGSADGPTTAIIRELRLPRVLAAALVGGARRRVSAGLVTTSSGARRFAMMASAGLDAEEIGRAHV